VEREKCGAGEKEFRIDGDVYGSQREATGKLKWRGGETGWKTQKKGRTRHMYKGFRKGGRGQGEDTHG